MKTLILPIKPVSWNQIATSHWRVYKRIKDAMAEVTAYELYRQKFKALDVSNGLNVRVDAFCKTKRRRDPDNLYIKPILDVMTSRNIIPDDNQDVIRSITYRVHIGADSDRVEMRFKPYEAD